MSENLIIGFVTMAVCLAIQCVVVGALLDALVFLEKKGLIRLTLVGVSSLLVAVMIIMLAGNIIQITIWAGLFFSYGEFKEFTTAFYHSVVNFATLGYGGYRDERKKASSWRLGGGQRRADVWSDNGLFVYDPQRSFGTILGRANRSKIETQSVIPHGHENRAKRGSRFRGFRFRVQGSKV
ncbi:MAG: hypothetical protein KJO34_18460 [Deltaproteobacteria bacterium]|nr:hypothetical protein [Deltaproteobacteria bacterium]